MRAGEGEDEEASAVSTALTIMLEIWGERTFTSMDVVKAMIVEMHTEGAEKAKAEPIGDALGELVGKRLDKPTARSIGKLLTKRLVGRPAWIGDGQMVATLKRSVGHNANTYQILVSATGQDLTANSSPNTGSCQRHSPHSPHSPPRDSGDGEMGNEGKGGKDIPVNEVDSSNFKRAKPSWRGRL
jgi:hypothetical protein